MFNLPQAESCLPGDVTWALGYDSTAWGYTGGWGGGHFKVNMKTMNFDNFNSSKQVVVFKELSLYQLSINNFRGIHRKLEFTQWKMQDTFMFTKINDGIP